MLPATRQRRNATILMISTPPNTPSHPFKTFCYHAEAKNSYIKMPIDEIPGVGKMEIRRAKAECLTETDFQREYMCQFVVNEDLAIVPEFITRKDEIVEEFKVAPHFLPFTAIDLGYIDATGCLLYTSPSPRDRQKSRMPSSA